MRQICRLVCTVIILCGVGGCNDYDTPKVPDTPDSPPKEDTKEEVGLPPFNNVNGVLFSARMMSYNVHNCKGTDNIVDYKRIADVITSHNVEAVAIQELDSMTTRYPNEDVLKNLAEHTKMHHTFGAAINYKGGKYGVGVLTREEPISHYTVPLPCSSEPRVLLVVELKNYYFCCTHFSLVAAYRKEAANIIVEAVQNLDKPVIVAGDLNALRSEEPIEILSEHFYVFEKQGIPYTAPSGNPTREIDYICLYKGGGTCVEVNESWVSPIAVLSDHRPVIADLTISQ